MLEGHVPTWPPRWRARKVERTLAILEGDRITTIDGELLELSSWEQLRAALFAHDLQVYSATLTSHRILVAAYQDPSVEIAARADGTAVGIRVREGHRTRWIMSSLGAWSAEPSVAFLRALEATHRLLGVDLTLTASALGQATMRKHWPHDQYQSRPHAQAWRWVYDAVIGGRVDTLQPGVTFRRIFEADLNDAYLAASRRLPAGTAVYWSGTREREEPLTDPGFATGLFRCTVVLWRDLPLGPFGMRTDDPGLNVHPTERGIYEDVMLWAEDIALLRSTGRGEEDPDGWEGGSVSVVMHEGWYWTAWTDGLAKWARILHRARRTAPAELAPLIKQAIVAGIGRFGTDRVRYSVVSRPRAPGDQPITDPKLGPVELWLHEEPADRGECQVHWSSYIVASVRRELYRQAVRHAADGTLIATNYDAIYTTRRPGRSSRELGRWKVRELHHATVPAARQLIADEKVRLPGVPYASRAPT